MNVTLENFPDVQGSYDEITKKITLSAGTVFRIDLGYRSGRLSGNFNRARGLCDTGALVMIGGQWQLTAQIICSPSEAWFFTSGKPGSGPKMWLIDELNHANHGKSIDTIGASRRTNTLLKSTTSPVRDPIQLIDIAKILTSNSDEEFYPSVKKYFAEKKRLEVVTGPKAKDLKWPAGPGVYVVSHKKEGVIYVGLTGKLTSPGNGKKPVFNGGRFSKRLSRTHPYCFQTEGEFADHFEFGCSFTVEKVRAAPLRDRYRTRYPLSEISTECFCLESAEKEVTPSFLEKLLLQTFFKKHERLPEANNEL
jgi:hypothetical protein